MFENEDNDMTDLASAVTSVTTIDGESNIDTNFSAVFTEPLSSE